MIEAVGGRKCFMFLIVAFLLAVLILTDKIDGGEFIKFLTVNFGFLVTGNSIENATKK